MQVCVCVWECVGVSPLLSVCVLVFMPVICTSKVQIIVAIWRLLLGCRWKIIHTKWKWKIIFNARGYSDRMTWDN